MPAERPARFTNADAARRHLEALRWRGRPLCPHCGMADKNSALQGKSTRPGLRWCKGCRKPFSVTVNSVFENSKVPLNLWLYANHLLCSSRTPISGQQLARALGVTYKTAWYMARHIREALSRS